MSINIKKSDVRWSYVSLVLFNSINLLMLPVILIYLTAEEVGLWYTFTAVSSLVVLLDLGFMTTLSRNITFVWSGAKEISAQGFTDSFTENEPNYSLFVKIFQVTKTIYLILGIIILFLLITVGSYYIYSVSNEEIPIQSALTSWIIYSIAIYLNMRYAYWNAILKGIGAIKKNQQILILTKMVQLIFTFIGLLLGYGIIAVSLAYLLSIFVNRMFAYIVFINYGENKGELKPIMNIKIMRKERNELLKKIAPNAFKQSFVSISNFINLRSLPLLSSAFLGLSVTAAVGFIIQVISLINVVANTFFNTYLPQFSAYRIKNNFDGLRRVFKKALLLNYFISISGYLIFFLFGSKIIEFMGSDINMPATEVFTCILVYMFLYNNHSIFATYLGTSNSISYWLPYIISSVIILVLQFYFVTEVNNSLWSLIIPLVIINSLYNNWKWPYEVFKEFKARDYH